MGKNVDMGHPFKIVLNNILTALEQEDTGSYYKEGRRKEGQRYSSRKNGKIALVGPENDAALKRLHVQNNRWENNYGVQEATLDFFDKLDGKQDGKINIKKARKNLFAQNAKEILANFAIEMEANAYGLIQVIKKEGSEALQPEQEDILNMVVRFNGVSQSLVLFYEIENQKDLGFVQEMSDKNRIIYDLEILMGLRAVPFDF